MKERWGVDPFEGYAALENSRATQDPFPCPTDPNAHIWLSDFQDPIESTTRMMMDFP